MRRVATGNDFLISLAVYNDAEALAAADSTPTVTVTKPDGTSVTPGAVSSSATGLYTSKIESLSAPTFLTVTWTYTLSSFNYQVVDHVAVDGGYIFRLDELRAVPELADTSRFPGAALVRAREEVTDFINDYTMSAFVPTYARDVQDGHNKVKTLVERVPAISIQAATVEGTTVDVSAFTITRSGFIRSASSWTGWRSTGQGVVVEYVYGHVPTPGDMKRAAIRLATTWLLANEQSIPDRARMMTTQWGTFQLSVAAEDYPTGVPEVDSVLRRYKIWIPSFA